MSKFNVGDKVRIKEDLSECKFGYTPHMDAYKGKEATVVKVHIGGEIKLDIDKQVWCWSENVLELIEEGKTMKMKRIDYILNSKDPIKVLTEEFELELNCEQCPQYDACEHVDCTDVLKEYLEQDIEVNESNLKDTDVESITIGQALQSIYDIPPQIKINSDKIKEVNVDNENDPVNPFMEEYEKIVTETMELCIKKNKDYGSSVQDTYERFGDVSYLVRITDKYNRICSLLDKKAEVKDESIDDTIRDMANYCFLWLASRNVNK